MKKIKLKHCTGKYSLNSKKEKKKAVKGIQNRDRKQKLNGIHKFDYINNYVKYEWIKQSN